MFVPGLNANYKTAFIYLIILRERS